MPTWYEIQYDLTIKENLRQRNIKEMAEIEDFYEDEVVNKKRKRFLQVIQKIRKEDKK